MEIIYLILFVLGDNQLAHLEFHDYHQQVAPQMHADMNCEQFLRSDLLRRYIAPRGFDGKTVRVACMGGQELGTHLAGLLRNAEGWPQVSAGTAAKKVKR